MEKLDILLQKNPIEVSARKTLLNDTMSTLPQVKRIRFVKILLMGLFISSLILFITKWFNNDLFYFIQLALNKFTLIKSQSVLYLAAFYESLPKQQLISILFSIILWMGWKKFETFLLHHRITNRMIQLTPRLAFVTGLLVITGIGFAGYGYAQKTEQQKLQLLREHVNQSGRIEFETNKSAKECSTSASTYTDPNLTNIYEIKKATGLNTEDAKKLIEAKCLEAQSQKFLYQTFNLENPEEGKTKKTTPDDFLISTSLAVQVVDKSDTFLIVQPACKSDTHKMCDTEKYSFTSQTKVFKDDKMASIEVVKKGDIVISLNKFYPQKTRESEPTRLEILGMVILPAEPEFKWYNIFLQYSLTQIKTCKGNPQDRCTFTGSIDFFPSGGGEGNTRNPLFVQKTDWERKEIAGVLTKIEETYVEIKTTSGRIFTINFGSNPVEEFNRDRSQYYDNEKVTIGDTLLVTYDEPTDSHSINLKTEQILNAVLMLEIVNKFDATKKY